MPGTLYFGDNLEILKEHFSDQSVDLIYLDPPFNSAATYNILFKSPDGKGSSSQITAFEDTWHWCEASELAFDSVLNSGRTEAANVLRAFRQFLGENDVMAYLSMMAVRLIELHRVLKPSESIYLHCDPTASHYLKLVMDAIFDKQNFLNEIIWRRTGSHSSSKRFGPVHDVILFYSKTSRYYWRRSRRPYMRGHVEKAFREIDGRYFTNYSGNILSGAGIRNGLSGQVWRGFDPTAKGRHWAIPSILLDGFEEETAHMNQHEKMDFLFNRGFITINPTDEWPRYRREVIREDGQSTSDVWAYQPYTEGTVFGSEAGIDNDIRWMGAKDPDRLGYPTQKPVGLLERIIQASCPPDGIVLDPFCGCGTTVHAAERLHRRWQGIDITPLAVNLISRRLKDAFPTTEFDIKGIPRDMEGAHALAGRDKHLFQLWATDLIGAQPYRDGKKGADGGIDGLVYFKPDGRTTKAAIVSVKGGTQLSVRHIRELRGTIERVQEPMGVFLTLHPPTEPMRREAAAAGLYDTGFGKPTPRLQIVTIEAALKLGQRAVQIPFGHTTSFKRAPREQDARPATRDLFGLATALQRDHQDKST